VVELRVELDTVELRIKLDVVELLIGLVVVELRVELDVVEIEVELDVLELCEIEIREDNEEGIYIELDGGGCNMEIDTEDVEQLPPILGPDVGGTCRLGANNN
jgi:hypothetical protein